MTNCFFKKRVALILALLFVLIEILMGIYVQKGETATTIVAYSSVVLAFLFVLYSFKKDYLWLFTALAMSFTLCADVFLVLVEPRKQLLAMFFFNFTQIFYALRLFSCEPLKKKKLIHLFIRLTVCLIAVISTIIVLKENLNALSIVSIIYYANLIVNVVYAFISRDFIFGVGLICFAVCDAFVGLSVLSQGLLEIKSGSFLHYIMHPGFDPVWAFYVPSQTLISISTFKRKFKI